MLVTNCAFLENELLDAARLFKTQPRSIVHDFRFEEGTFYNDFEIDGEKYAFEDKGQVCDELHFKRLERRFAKLRLYEILSEKYGEKIAVGADVADGKIAIKGWLEKSAYSLDEFLTKMQNLGVKTVICTDVSKDGAMKGPNCDLYNHIAQTYSLEVVASGGVSSIEDIKTLKEAGAHGAIVGKAYYIGAIDLAQAISLAAEEVAK